MILVTTFGSSKVLVSPSSLNSPLAIFLSIRLIIFPDLVFGSPSTYRNLSTLAIGPTCLVIKSLISIPVAFLFLGEEWQIMYANIPFPFIVWGYPTIALSQTFLCSSIALSISAVPKLWPETIRTSSTLPVILKSPSSFLKHPSPLKYLPGKDEK